MSSTRGVTVIIPASNVVDYIEAALLSILEQADEGVEIIVIDNGSTDGTSGVLERLGTTSTTSATLIVRSDPRAVGPGAARNEGLSLATGELIMFLDGDDLLSPGALDVVRAAFADHPRADVVMYDFDRLELDGGRTANPHRRVLADAASGSAGGSVSLAERPELLRVINVAWNKAYSRSFLEAEGLRFPDGIYEDLPWNIGVLVGAREIVVVPEPLVLYRQRAGSLRRLEGSQHADIFAQWEAAWQILRDADEPVRREAFSYMQRQLLAIFREPQRIPRQLRRDYRRRMVKILGAHLDEAGTTERGLRSWLINRSPYQVFRLAEGLSSVVARQPSA